jgi:putative methionine-R-sulfoxide reductase with GAF domain
MSARRQLVYRWVVISVGWALAILLVPQLDLRSWLGIFLLLVVSVAAESTTIPLPYGGLTTPNFVAFYVTLFICGPATACWVALLTAFLVDRVWRQRRAFVFLFNGALYVVSILATNYTFSLLGGEMATVSVAALPPLSVCAAVYFLVNNSMVYVYYALQKGFSPSGWWEFVKWDGLGHLVLAPIAVLIVLTYFALGVPAAILFLPILLGVWYALKVNVEVGVSNRSLAVMYRIDKDISTIVGLEELGRRILDAVRTVAKYEHSSLWLMDEEGKKLVFQTGMGCSEHVPEGFSIQVGEGIIGWVAENGETLLVPDVHEDPRYIPIEGREGIESEVVVPLSVENKVLGVLAIDFTFR